MRLLRELVRQVELAHRDLDLHARIGVVAEHLGDAADRLRVLARLRDEIDGHHLPGLGLARLRRRHQDVVRDAPVFGHEEQHAVLGVQAADDAAVARARALRRLRRSARPRWSRPPTRTAARSPCMSWRISAGGRKIELPAVVGNEEAVAVGMAFDAPGDERDALRDEQAPGAVLHHVAGALERARARGRNRGARGARRAAARRARRRVSGARAAFSASRMRPGCGACSRGARLRRRRAVLLAFFFDTSEACN